MGVDTGDQQRRAGARLVWTVRGADRSGCRRGGEDRTRPEPARQNTPVHAGTCTRCGRAHASGPSAVPAPVGRGSVTRAAPSESDECALLWVNVFTPVKQQRHLHLHNIVRAWALIVRGCLLSVNVSDLLSPLLPGSLLSSLSTFLYQLRKRK